MLSRLFLLILNEISAKIDLLRLFFASFTKLAIFAA